MNLPACPPIRQNILKAIYHIHDQCTKYGHLIACSEKEEIWECGGGSDKQRGGKNLGSLLVNETHHKKRLIMTQWEVNTSISFLMGFLGVFLSSHHIILYGR